MLGSKILEVAIGVIFVFLLVSMICSAIREGIESWRKTRAAFLEQGIRELLHDRHAVGIARSVYTHPLIYGLYLDDYRPRASSQPLGPLTRGGNLPSYIPARNFALALIDIAARGTGHHGGASNPAAPVLSLPLVRANVLNIENGPVQRILLGAIDTANGDMNRAVDNLTVWFDSGMDRVSGAYKRATQKLLLGIGLALAVLLNVNTIAIAHYLFRHDAERAAIVARAEAVARDPSFVRDTGQGQYTRARAALDSLRLPIGWDNARFVVPWETRLVRGANGAVDTELALRLWEHVFEPIVGWLLTAMAAMLGAAFWFDLLNKVMVVRSTVKPHEKSPEEASEDRQPKKDRTIVLASGTSDAGGAPARGAAPRASPTAAAHAEGALADSGALDVEPPDPDLEIDLCDVKADASTTLTQDEELPAARGGVR
jgi:hypothetical protein